MPLITDIGTVIDTTLVTYVQSVFTAVALPIRNILNSAALVGLLFVAVNHILQFSQVSYSTYLSWAFRYLLISMFATIWLNFQFIYEIVIEIPEDYSALLLGAVPLNVSGANTDIVDPGRITDVYSAIDEFINGIFNIAKELFDKISIWKPGQAIKYALLGTATMVIGALFAGASAVVVMMGKIGFALAMSFAPLAIAMLMLPQTRGHFENWSRFVVGFAIIPLLVTGLMTITLMTASNFINGGADLGLIDYIGLLLVIIGAIVLMYMIPTLASSLAASSVAAVGAGAAFAGARMLKGATIGAAKSGARNAIGGYTAIKDASKAGGAGGFARSLTSSMLQSSGARANRVETALASARAGKAPIPQKALPAPTSGAANTPAPPSTGGARLKPEQQNLNR